MPFLSFIKMQGCGNDFVIVDWQDGWERFPLSPPHIQKLSHRHYGIGFDQLLVVVHSPHDSPMVYIFNADGSQSAACGNGMRCVAWHLARGQKLPARISCQTQAGMLHATVHTNGVVTLNMGKFHREWNQIPLLSPCDTACLPLTEGPLQGGFAVSLGNPHVVFFVDNVADMDFETLGQRVALNPLFPQGVNVHIASIQSPTHLIHRIWERGVGITLSCGSGACAVAIAAAVCHGTSRHVTVEQPGGSLHIEWIHGDEILLSGPVTPVFTGQVPLASLPSFCAL